MNKSAIAMIGLLTGALLGAGGIYLAGDEAAGGETTDEPRPLYWVAPMDPSYRRDEPGKSPMGMDLVPVYDNGGQQESGVVAISPVVENNLGVRTGRVARGALHLPVETVGYVRFDEERLQHLHPRVEGWIETLHVKTEGEFVSAGQPLYAIYSPELVNAQEELLLALEQNNGRLIRSAEERLKALQVPQARIAQLKADREVSRTITVRADTDGLVAGLNIREGHFVQPGGEMMSIGVLDEVWVIAEVFERQVAMVETGDPVTMTLDYMPGRAWRGEVDFIYPTLDERTRTVRVRLRFDNADQALKPNMFARVTIHGGEEQPVLLVPNEAVIRGGDRDRVVLALGEGRYKSVAVVIGRRGADSTEVLEGLRDGDTVVTSAHFLLDSESSIASDFRRMDAAGVMGAMAPEDEDSMAMAESYTAAMDMEESGEMTVDVGGGPEGVGDTVSTRATVERVMGKSMINVAHDPIPAWEWPAMTMMFEVADDVDLSGVETGDRVELEITRDADGQRVTGIRPAD